MSCPGTRASLWAGLVLSLLCAMMSGIDMSFNTYAIALKETFNYTQVQVEFIASMGSVGLALSFLEMVSTWLFGYVVTCVIVVIGIPTSVGLFAVVSYYNQIFHDWPGVVGAIQLYLSTVNNIGFFAVSRVCIEQFSSKHTGKLIGAYMAFGCLGKIYYSVLIELLDSSLFMFFLSISVTNGVLYLAGFLLLCPVVHGRTEQKEIIGLEPTKSRSELQTEGKVVKAVRNNDSKFRPAKQEKPNNPNTESSQTKPVEEESPDKPAVDMLKSPFFHIIFWSSIVFHGCGYNCLNNITILAQSLHVDDPLMMVMISSVVIVITRLTFGAIFDRFPSPWCSFCLLVTSYVCLFAAMVVGLVEINGSIMPVCAILMGVGIGPALITPVSAILVRFGRTHYSPVASFFYTGACLCQVILQLETGFFYDLEIPAQVHTGKTCYGKDCFYWSFIIMLILTVIVFVLQAVNFSIFDRTKDS